MTSRHACGLTSTIAALACGLFAWLFSGQALGYCRTTTCNDCPRDEQGCSTGETPLTWPGRCVGFGVHAAASHSIDLETVERVTQEALDTWNAVRCGPSELRPSIELRPLGRPLLCGRSEYVDDAANANALIFQDEIWPYGGVAHELASTRVRSRPDGTIIDADIEINALRPLLVDTDAGMERGKITGAHDLLSIITHELGHLLGLDHSQEPGSIMQVRLPVRAERRMLGDDDVAAICEIYPPHREAEACDPTPYGEFSPHCALDPSTGGACSVFNPGTILSAGRGAGPAFLVLPWMVLALRRRARRRRLILPRTRAGRASTAGDRDARD
ncbi:MAG: matrixin family metalloprotease [Myxococcales bacterium]|nr:matrixin family metalloprotease [Myxococcales bacterium]